MPSKGKGWHEPSGPFIQLGRPKFACLALITESFILLCSPPPAPCVPRGPGTPEDGTCLPEAAGAPGCQDGRAGERAAASFSTLVTALGSQVSQRILGSQVLAGCNGVPLLGQ